MEIGITWKEIRVCLGFMDVVDKQVGRMGNWPDEKEGTSVLVRSASKILLQSVNAPNHRVLVRSTIFNASLIFVKPDMQISILKNGHA